jgi:hypothetical protein
MELLAILAFKTKTTLWTAPTCGLSLAVVANCHISKALPSYRKHLKVQEKFQVSESVSHKKNWSM